MVQEAVIPFWAGAIHIVTEVSSGCCWQGSIILQGKENRIKDERGSGMKNDAHSTALTGWTGSALGVVIFVTGQYKDTTQICKVSAKISNLHKCWHRWKARWQSQLMEGGLACKLVKWFFSIFKLAKRSQGLHQIGRSSATPETIYEYMKLVSTLTILVARKKTHPELLINAWNLTSSKRQLATMEVDTR